MKEEIKVIKVKYSEIKFTMLNFISVSFCTAYIILLGLGLGSVLGLELGFRVKVVMVEANSLDKNNRGSSAHLWAKCA